VRQIVIDHVRQRLDVDARARCRRDQMKLAVLEALQGFIRCGWLCSRGSPRLDAVLLQLIGERFAPCLVRVNTILLPVVRLYEMGEQFASGPCRPVRDLEINSIAVAPPISPSPRRHEARASVRTRRNVREQQFWRFAAGAEDARCLMKPMSSCGRLVEHQIPPGAGRWSSAHVIEQAAGRRDDDVDPCAARGLRAEAHAA